MSFEQHWALPIIGGMDMKLQPGWHQIKPQQAVQPWAKNLARQLGQGRAGRQALEEDLVRIHAAYAGLDNPYGRYAVRISQTGRVQCRMFYTPNFALDEHSPLYSIDPYERQLHTPDNEPGAHVDIVSVWREVISVGEYAAQYSVIHYTDLATESRHDEERISVGVFPVGSSQILELVFSTPAVGANGNDLVGLVRSMLQTMTIRLEPR